MYVYNEKLASSQATDNILPPMGPSDDQTPGREIDPYRLYITPASWQPPMTSPHINPRLCLYFQIGSYL